MPEYSPLNKALMAVTLRAELPELDEVAATFVNIGPLGDVLRRPDHQVLLGRRGSGKTHALRYLQASINREGGAAAFVSLAGVGGPRDAYYRDISVPFSERATKIVVEVLAAIERALGAARLGPTGFLDRRRKRVLLDRYAAELGRVRVEGLVEQEVTLALGRSRSTDLGAVMELGPRVPMGAAANRHKEERVDYTALVRRFGIERYQVDYGALASLVRQLTDIGHVPRLWILLDEWESIPDSLQPVVADALRRTFTSTGVITLKIGAIPWFSRFSERTAAGDRVGLVFGADLPSVVDLDRILSTARGTPHAETFLRELLGRHVGYALASATHRKQVEVTSASLVDEAFARGALAELVRAVAGLPRDAINVAGAAAQLAIDKPIQKKDVWEAARSWYLSDKLDPLRDDFIVAIFLTYLLDSFIGERRCSGFLVEEEPGLDEDPLLAGLCAGRVLHLVARGVTPVDHKVSSSFSLYELDFAAYCHLPRSRWPLGLLRTAGGTKFVERWPTQLSDVGDAVLELDVFKRTLGYFYARRLRGQDVDNPWSSRYGPASSDSAPG